MIVFLAEVTVTNTQLGIFMAALSAVLALLTKGIAIKRDLASQIINQLKAEETKPKREVGPQPFRVQTEHDCIPRPEYDVREEKIWKVVNGLRREASDVAASVARIQEAREQNGERLEKLEAGQTEMNRTMGELAGSVQGLARTMDKLTADALSNMLNGKVEAKA